MKKSAFKSTPVNEVALTEAYLNEFYKTAEEYGVDPECLLKLASGEYEGAVAPAEAQAIGQSDMPYFWPRWSGTVQGIRDSGGTGRYADYWKDLPARQASNIQGYNNSKGQSLNNALGTTGKYDPRWLAAHQEASQYAVAPLSDIEGNPLIEKEHMDAINKRYHEKMFDLTNMPQRVSYKMPY